MNLYSFRHYVRKFLNDEKNDGKLNNKWVRELLTDLQCSFFNLSLDRPDNRGPLYPRRQSDWLFNSQILDQGEAIQTGRCC